MPTARVTVGGLLSGVVTSAAPVITPGGLADPGRQLVLWQAEIRRTSSNTPLAARQGVVFAPWDHGLGLEAGTLYEARVRVQQDDWQWSPWATTTFRVQALTPPSPVINLEQIRHPSTLAPFVRVSLIYPATGYDYGQKILLDVEREDDRYGWVRFTQRWMTPGVREVFIDDYAVPSDFADRRYRVKPTIWVSGQPQAGGYTYSGPLTFKARATSAFLVDPDHPELAVRAHMEKRSARKHPSGGTAVSLLSMLPSDISTGMSHHPPLMADRISYRVPSLESGDMSIRADSRDDAENVLTMLQSGERLLYRASRELDYEGRRTPGEDLWFRATGDITVDDRFAQAAQARLITVQWEAQYPPGVERSGMRVR